MTEKNTGPRENVLGASSREGCEKETVCIESPVASATGRIGEQSCA